MDPTMMACCHNQGQTETYGRPGRLIIWCPFKPIFFKHLFSTFIQWWQGETDFLLTKIAYLILYILNKRFIIGTECNVTF
jgi:hypothetical protein